MTMVRLTQAHASPVIKIARFWEAARLLSCVICVPRPFADSRLGLSDVPIDAPIEVDMAEEVLLPRGQSLRASCPEVTKPTGRDTESHEAQTSNDRSKPLQGSVHAQARGDKRNPISSWVAERTYLLKARMIISYDYCIQLMAPADVDGRKMS
jgi:hypothetical protein